ncbi:hypothetical protein GRI38_12075 [Altererythrobacter aurantiacus]|uniref:Uncharacterized protein n=1 Tax=Parapontixanthobacter aurantiacus TaxID=1463599 RepID=A0A844ZHP2_9SPHN|nr:hypothetical protein [Parapontixanthobacter aurantiacus]MXO86762.1 hypothetical protein [Parapontixanthobacter aurantiacus]
MVNDWLTMLNAKQAERGEPPTIGEFRQARLGKLVAQISRRGQLRDQFVPAKATKGFPLATRRHVGFLYIALEHGQGVTAAQVKNP